MSTPKAKPDTDVNDIMRKFDRESNTRIWTGGTKIAVKIYLALFALYCILMTLFSTALPEVRLPLFMGFILIAGFLKFPVRRGEPKPNTMPWYDMVLTVLGVGSCFYFAANALPIIQSAGRLEPFQVVIGCVGIMVIAELCRRCVGVPILCVAGVLLIYAFVNKLSYNPNFYQVLRKVVYQLFYTTSGIIGTPVNVCYTYIVLFIIFGAFLERTGIAGFFISLANRLAGWSAGGPAKVAVISSALCGMVSGSSVGNTVTTGSFTIPMMKKTGYRPEFAGAVEAAASTGGQIMPPIMGAAAFLMAEYMGIPYAQVAVKAILPAALYFTGIFIAVHLEAKKLGLRGIPREELPRWRTLLRDSYLLVPLVLLVWLVASGTKTMSHAAAYSILAAIAVGAVNFFLTARCGTEGTAPANGKKAIAAAGEKTFFSAVDSLEAGTGGAVTVAVACAMAGIIAGCITITGLASTLINAIVQLAGNATIIGLVLTMLCCIVLGMGVPTTANYCIMASTCAPILMQLGFQPIAAHFFVFYFGIVADITPPVALAAYAGAAIAKANPMKTGLTATKLAIAAFIVPYIFAYSPMLLFDGVRGVFAVLQIVCSALIGLFGVAAALNGYLYRGTHPLLRLLLAAGGMGMMIPGTCSDVIGLVIIVAIAVFQKRRALR